MKNTAKNTHTSPKPTNRVGRARRSIQGRLLALSLGTTLLAVLVVVVNAFNLARILSTEAQSIASQSLREQAKDYLGQINSTITDQNQLILDRAARDVLTVAEAAAEIYNSDIPMDYWNHEEHMETGPDGQYSNSKADISSVFVPNFQEINDLVQLDIEKSAYLNLIMKPVFDNNPNASAIYLGTESEVTRYYPNIELGKVLPPDFRVTERIWYTASTQSNHSEILPVWAPVYTDATGLGLVTTVSAPVFKQGDQLIGVVGLDLTLDEISNNIQTSRFLESGYSFLIDQEGKSIILPDQGYQDILDRAPQENEYASDLINNSSEFKAVIEEMAAGQSGLISLQSGGKELFVAYSPIESTGWSLGSVVASEEILASIGNLQEELGKQARNLILTRAIPIVLLIIIVLVFLILTWTNRLIRPLQSLANAAGEIGAGNWEVEIPVSGDDEIGVLAQTISDMRSQLQESFEELEQRVIERTQDLEQRAGQLQTSAEVVRTIASVRNLDQLLTQITHLISTRFGYYHVGVFLVDEKREYVVLHAANSPGGQQMLERGHRLEIGQTGIVGKAAKIQAPRITMDVMQDEVFYDNPDLPETRSEMALPLITGEKLLGILDIQSKSTAAFNEKDINLLQTLADQIAIAIENAQLFSENKQALETIQKAYNEMSGEAWKNLLRTEPEFGYLCTPLSEPVTVEGEWDAGMIQAQNTGHLVEIDNHTLAVPIKIREQVMGVIKLRKPLGGESWLREEIELVETLCDRLSTALESARLFEESQRRAERERMTADIVTKLRSSNDPQTILQTAAFEIQQALKAKRAQLTIQGTPPDTSQKLQEEQ